MKKVIVIGCPGSGKSTFSRALSRVTGLPLYYLDMIYHKPDKSTFTRQEFDEKLNEIMKHDSWIIDGNYARTISVRLAQCDTVFWLDYPLEVCLKGIEERKGKPRPDMPWIETEEDKEFLEFVRHFKQENYPKMKEMLRQSSDKDITIFTSREMAAEYLQQLEML